MNRLIKYCCLLLATLSAFTACTKTEDLPDLPQDRILEYHVSNVPAGESLYGAVDQTTKTITVYVPFYYGLELIDPEIKLSSGARLSEEIAPITIDTQNQTYTVIAANGTRNTYTLKIVQQNTPQLVLTWANSGYPTTKPIAYPVRILPNIRGNFYSNNPALVKVSLQSRNTKKEVVLNSMNTSVRLTPVSGQINNYQLSNLPIPASIDTGRHDVKINYLGHDVTLADPINIQYQAPQINYNPSQIVKQGAEISYDAYPQLVILNPTSVKVTANGQVYDFKIVKHSFEAITLQVPDNFPTGQGYYTAITTFQGWPSRTNTLNLSISPK
ncbi:hypothetical protein [Sphingobacterium psychroaquaticum]|uniref:DUF5018 domain-containing protein n=1 Tax=Sphingobacterium psychroaquaticum TaxID=561061 RepID=A0A1X7JKS9_9SPHI|nr:hypothetical protein [Sphingobacterium psychroaquaticum]SMG28541.1 hypothetical protein SAMN05660862_1815 [Sphingobacterium psychroaquaticum]